jgi:hypothetical protein
MTKIICFAGRKQSGKTTLCNQVLNFIYDLERLEDFSTIYNFADPLKDLCINILGLTFDQCYGNDEQKNELVNCYRNSEQMTAREVLQVVGTDFFRSIQHNVWADATIRRIQQDNAPVSLIGDCRFPNEVEAVKRAGGTVIKLTRNIYNSDHASETALDPENYDPSNFDLVVDNQHLTIEEQWHVVLRWLLENKKL